MKEEFGVYSLVLGKQKLTRRVIDLTVNKVVFFCKKQICQVL